MLKAGDLDKRVRIEGYTVTRDPDYNTEIRTWGPIATVWAQVQDVLPSKSETVQDAVQMAERPSRVRMRYRAGITPDMRLVVLGVDGAPDRVCEIVAGPAELGRREGIELLVKDYGGAP
ncbi:head-tail adaptor protein [Melaminivora sp.]|uniref:head-tail adaptor protein n=1 Tax=Melaminivora sp. TaxID=1933032 RepID=UPI0028AAF2D4|nr:head-tail adaptor protein [Melaminivora sp.]